MLAFFIFTSVLFSLLFIFERENSRYWRDLSEEYQDNYHRVLGEDIKRLRQKVKVKE